MYFIVFLKNLLCFSTPHANTPISFGQREKKPSSCNLPQRVESFSADQPYFPEAAGGRQCGCQLKQYVPRGRALQRICTFSLYVSEPLRDIPFAWFCFTGSWKALTFADSNPSISNLSYCLLPPSTSRMSKLNIHLSSP